MNTDTPTSADYSDPLTRHNASSLSGYMIWCSHCIGNDSSLTQDHALGDTYQVMGRNDDIFSKSAINPRSNIALIVYAEHLPTRCAHYTASTEEIKRTRNRAPFFPPFYPCSQTPNIPTPLIT